MSQSLLGIIPVVNLYDTLGRNDRFTLGFPETKNFENDRNCLMQLNCALSTLTVFLFTKENTLSARMAFLEKENKKRMANYKSSIYAFMKKQMSLAYEFCGVFWFLVYFRSYVV